MRAEILRLAAAVLILAGGALHVRLALEAYGTPDLITLFLVNGIGSAVVAALIAADRGPLSALAGFGLSAVSLLAFGLSRVGDGVVGFRGVGLDPSPDALLTLLAEGLALLLTAALVATGREQLWLLVRGDRRRA